MTATRRALGVLTALALTAASTLAAAAQDASRRPHDRLFPPQDLGLLEGPDRDAWQKPDQVMDALGIADGGRVADLGAGAGWFTIRLARRVGPNGLVYAVDVQPQAIEAISRRVAREGLRNVRTVHGTSSDPRLPPGELDAVVIVDTFYEIEDPVALLKNVARALGPKGRVGIIDFRREGGGPGPPPEERVDPAVVIRDAETAGLRLLSRETFLPFQFLLVFGQNVAAPVQTSAR
jgi:ubiquinone/menaquinone biosynthesis C-methylase UbiE